MTAVGVIFMVQKKSPHQPTLYHQREKDITLFVFVRPASFDPWGHKAFNWVRAITFDVFFNG